ncbi:MAG: hypothetical protein V4538_02355 [Bacteroidota bacterium]
MMKSKRNWRTNIIGYLILLFIVAALIMFLTGKINIEQAGAFIVLIVGVLTAIGFLKSADAKNNDNNYYNGGK